MTVTVNVTGLEPISEAINSLAKALGRPGAVTTFKDVPDGFEPAGRTPFDKETDTAKKSDAQQMPPETVPAQTEPGDAQEESAFTLEEVRAKLAELQKAGKRAEVKTLLGSFGVTKLSEVPAERYAALMVKAGEI